jgi:hypothetical protein
VSSVRRFGVCEIAPEEQKVERNDLLGHPTHLAEKSKGEISMLGKQDKAKVCSQVGLQVLYAW